MRLAPLASGLLVAALALAAPSVALADPSPQDISQARDLGQQAQAAFDAGNFPESERLFTAAANLFPAPTLTLGAARAQVKQTKLVLARESYNRIIREQGNNPNASQAFKDALAAAQAEINDVSAKIAHVTIKVDGAPSAQVSIDGEAVPAAGIGVSRPIDPGTHKVKAEAPGYQTAETTFQVGDAGNAEAKLTLTKIPGGDTAPPVAPTAPPPKEDGKPDHTLAFIALGVGGAGLVFGGITGVLALGKHGDLSDQCSGGTCPARFQSDVDSFHTMATLSTVGFIVGAVGVAAGAVLWFTAPKKTGFEWHPYVGAGNGGIAGRF